MAKWIDKLHSFGIEETPAELLLPALLSCDEILSNLLRTGMRSFKCVYDWLSPDKLTLWEQRTSNELNRQFNDILKNITFKGSKPDIIAAIKDFVVHSQHIQNIVTNALGKDCKPHAHIFF